MRTLLARMRTSAEEDAPYYAFTLDADITGQASLGTQTHWIGWVDDDPKKAEIRVASLVDLVQMAAQWTELGRSHLVVRTADEFGVYLFVGGNALIAEPVVRMELPDRLNPSPAYRAGGSGYVGAAEMFGRGGRSTPARKLRASILERDGHACVLCGASSHTDEHVVLVIHHVRPKGMGGPTLPENLLTLCQSCHNGLRPHFNPRLYSWSRLDVSHERLPPDEDHRRAVARYRARYKGAHPAAEPQRAAPSASVRGRVLAFDDYSCRSCRRSATAGSVRLHVVRVTPKRTNGPSDFATLCGDCRTLTTAG